MGETSISNTESQDGYNRNCENREQDNCKDHKLVCEPMEVDASITANMHEGCSHIENGTEGSSGDTINVQEDFVDTICEPPANLTKTPLTAKERAARYRKNNPLKRKFEQIKYKKTEEGKAAGKAADMKYKKTEEGKAAGKAA